MKNFNAKAITITLLILHFSHFNVYIFVEKKTSIRIYINKYYIPNMVLLSNLTEYINVTQYI